MEINIYFATSFTNETANIAKISGEGASAQIDRSTITTTKAMYEEGWRLTHAIKTAGSAQLESFNFLLIFER